MSIEDTLWTLPQGAPPGSHGESEKSPCMALVGEGEDLSFWNNLRACSSTKDLVFKENTLPEHCPT